MACLRECQPFSRTRWLIIRNMCSNLNISLKFQTLRSIVKNCLQMCNSSGKKSIAFPAIGTGILGFPHDVAAKIFFEETKEFDKKTTSCTITEVSC